MCPSPPPCGPFTVSQYFLFFRERKDAEESHTDVGVHRLAPRVEPRGGRGVLEENDANGRQYELVATGLDEKRNGVSDAGIVRISKE